MTIKNTYHARFRFGLPIRWLQSARDPAERAVLRDIWLYAGMLLGVGSVITIVFSGFAPLLVWPVFMMLALVCTSGALILHLDTLERWARARRKGEKPDLKRIFD
jgi:fatty acid desaturase